MAHIHRYMCLCERIQTDMRSAYTHRETEIQRETAITANRLIENG